MQVFIAGPLSNKTDRDTDFYNDISSICREIGLKTFLPHLHTKPIDEQADVKLVFQLDFKGLQNSKLLIAEVSELSHGVGGELMQALFQKIPIICLVKEGKTISKMVLGNTMVKKIIEYKHKKQCLQKLKEYLLCYKDINL